jgi:transposase
MRPRPQGHRDAARAQPRVRGRPLSHLALIADVTREIKATRSEIEACAKEDPYVPVLCQIRGVGHYSAMLIIAEVGAIDRFATARRLCSWAGLTPTVRSSDGKARLGHISSQGSRPLRWALVEAAQHAGTGGGPLRETYERITKGRGKQIAKVALARKILTLCFYGLRDGEIRCLAPRAKARGQTAGGQPMTRRADHAPPARAEATPRASSAVVNGLRSPNHS